MPSGRNLITGFVAGALRFPDRTALRLGSTEYTYGELYRLSSSVARTITVHHRERQRLAALVANRSLTAFAGVNGTLLSGAGYVPVNPAFPPGRIAQILTAAGCSTVIAEPGALSAVAAATAKDGRSLLILSPEAEPSGEERQLLSRHTVIGPGGMSPGDPCPPLPPGPGDLAYVMFTSGSTGTPKGVMTGHDSIGWVLDVLQSRYGISETDRVSLNAEMTFSASVLMMFLAYNGGAAICCPSKKDLLNPARFITENGITVWKCVPSLAALMDRMHQLRPGAFPTVRITTFGGEPAPADLVTRWQAAAPASVIEIVYGSTELTINTTFYTWDPVRSPAECTRGVVPIGMPLPGVTIAVCDEHLREVAPGEAGELLVAGPLVTAGYLGDAGMTQAAYITLPAREGVFFRTGDIVLRPGAGGPLVYRGRRDNQIKVLGNRVELGEIEAIGRSVLETREIAAFGWPPSPRGFDGIEVFIGDLATTEHDVLRTLKAHLPAYMLPRRAHVYEHLPLNPSGKIDRMALRRILEKEQA